MHASPFSYEPSPLRPPSPPDGRPLRDRLETAAACRLALAIAAAAFDGAPEEIGAPARRAASVADARHVAIYLAHVVFQLPMQAVAQGFGRDRTSIGHAVRRVEDRRDEAGFDAQMERLERLASFCGAGAAWAGPRT